MKKIRVVILGTNCKDKATKLNGTITHWSISMGGQIHYIFQPKGLDDEGQPVRALVLEVERLLSVEKYFEEVNVPFEILGTTVTDTASGFTGMAVSFTRHINGCFHVWIQPEGLQKKKKDPISKCDFDLRGCIGDMIKPLSEKALKKSKEDTPSPARCDVSDTGLSPKRKAQKDLLSNLVNFRE